MPESPPEVHIYGAVELDTSSGGNYAPAFVADGPMEGTWVYTFHDPAVRLTASGTGFDGNVVYQFSVEAGRPTLRLA